MMPYIVEYSETEFRYEVRDTRTNRVAHTFKFHPDAESRKDSMNEWVKQEALLDIAQARMMAWALERVFQ